MLSLSHKRAPSSSDNLPFVPQYSSDDANVRCTFHGYVSFRTSAWELDGKMCGSFVAKRREEPQTKPSQ
ncbi:hypothetical protein Ddc_15928 [Ditylenchus destructor]|nr:hypothetical protein Ddc_15928 [Ditylenchus destructor]